MNRINLKKKSKLVNLTMESLLIYRMVFKKDMITDIFHLIELLQNLNRLIEYEVEIDSKTNKEKVVGAYIVNKEEYKKIQDDIANSNILIELLWTMLYTADKENTKDYFSFNKDYTIKELVEQNNILLEIMSFVEIKSNKELDNITNNDIGIDEDTSNEITTNSIFITCKEVGLTMEQLKYMTLGNCMEYINEYNKVQQEINKSSNNDSGKSSIRKATQADIDAFIYG